MGSVMHCEFAVQYGHPLKEGCRFPLSSQWLWTLEPDVAVYKKGLSRYAMSPAITTTFVTESVSRDCHRKRFTHGFTLPRRALSIFPAYISRTSEHGRLMNSCYAEQSLTACRNDHLVIVRNKWGYIINGGYTTG